MRAGTQFLVVCCLLVGAAIAGETVRSPAVPAWATQAVWYQVLVCRFCNGDAANDPPGTVSWSSDWGSLLPGEQGPLRDRLFERQYGGDLAGLRSKLAYIRDLGVNAVYLNPIFQAPSQHKYDTADHRHIDDTYGKAGSMAAISGETEDPDTWQWSASDRLFLSLLEEAHGMGLRVVIDGVFNHVGREFWAWRDVVENGRNSAYANWFDVTDWGPPLRWRAWDGPDGHLPCFRREGDGLDPAVEAYLFAVVGRWMDPNGDGDPSDGIDGWRLDAAEQVSHGFWRRFRRTVKAVNPDAIIIGEIWTDAGPWLGGDEFDVVTNYPFAAPVLRFFTQDDTGYSATGLRDDLLGLAGGHPWHVTTGMLNLLGSHDTERVASALTDPQRRMSEAAGAIPRRDLLVPDADAYRRMRLAVVLQYTWPGAPIIYYGDEVGMYGGDDPFCRAPMWWDRAGNGGLGDLYRRLAVLRQEQPALRTGPVCVLVADDASRVLAFQRG
ncbi:MAG: glycoside hydrolase family 13 protein, partial [Phycisphaerae bacterium]|nr:glycoside hydrolase family 13 protein [Phycisphaerae bacterium]